MNISGHEESIKNILLCVELCLMFSAGQLIKCMTRNAVPGGGACRHLGRPGVILSLDFMSLTSMNIDEIKDPCDNTACKLHANQTPATSLIL